MVAEPRNVAHVVAMHVVQLYAPVQHGKQLLHLGNFTKLSGPHQSGTVGPELLTGSGGAYSLPSY